MVFNGMDRLHFICSRVDGFLDDCHFLAIANNVYFLPEVQPMGILFSRISTHMRVIFDFANVSINLMFQFALL